VVADLGRCLCESAEVRGKVAIVEGFVICGKGRDEVDGVGEVRGRRPILGLRVGYWWWDLVTAVLRGRRRILSLRGDSGYGH
jgi:hypothetical protein